MENVVDHLKAHRHVKAGGVTLPRQLIEVVVDAVDNPDITAPGAQRRAVVGEKGEVAGANPGLPRIFKRQGNFVDRVGVACPT